VRTPERGTSVGVRGLSGDGLPSKDNVVFPDKRSYNEVKTRDEFSR